jgi:hypothetical protein
MPFRLCGVADEGDRDAVRTSCTPTRPTMPDPADRSAGHGGSSRASRGRVSKAARNSVGIVGSSNVPTRGCNRFRRLPVRYERRSDIYEAFTSLVTSLITLNQIKRVC